MYWQCGRFKIDLSMPKIMGILNITPDSFSDGGMLTDVKTALQQAEQLLKDGADMLDIGGESSRPGADEVSIANELNRILPVLKELKSWNIPISVDTRRTKIMQELLSQGLTDIINDIYALRDDGALELLANAKEIGICLMHMQGEPKTMQKQPEYSDVVVEVSDFLQKRIDACISSGISIERIVVDPGFGFGKTLAHNLALLRSIRYMSQKIDTPLLIGVSRKSMFSGITGEQVPTARVIESVVTAYEACRNGAKIIRVHDVKEHKKALQILESVITD